jgi:predicted RNase H-like nuclease (RuvC/YqgF family)
MEQEEKNTLQKQPQNNVNNIELDDFLRWYGELSIQLKQSTENFEKLLGQAQPLVKENAELKSQLMAGKQKDDIVNQLNERIAEFENQNSIFDSERRQKETEIENLRKSLRACEQEKERLTAECSQQATYIDELKHTIDDLRDKLEACKKSSAKSKSSKRK